MIEPLLARGGDLVTRADVCVIGSGAGGAVAAAELAAAGRDVVVLEQGSHWTARDFTQREDEMLPRLFEEAGMRQTVDGGITILQGRCVGGSTVHNLCYSFRTPPAILRMWREEHGLPELTEQALAESFARVEANLRVKPIREDEVNTLNRLLRAGAEELGYSGFVTQHNRENCVRAGYCLLGCSYDAKQSMLVTYVPRASESGARVYPNARAERIEAPPSGPRRVLGSVVDEAGRSRGRIEVEARVVVLAAGAVASPDLLLRSGLGGPEVGRHLHLHPSVMVAGYWPEPIHAYRGIPQSYYIDEFIDLERDPHSGYVLMPISGFPVLVAVNTPGFGREHFRQMRDFSKLGGLLVLLHDRSEGSVRSGDSLGKPEIRYALDAEDRAQLA
jgi:glycine/D-amino acid oxidase-like deaminating enzyme